MDIKILLIKKGILTEDEIKQEHHKLLKEKRDRYEQERKVICIGDKSIVGLRF